jgi:hypothetical protein
MFKHLAHVEDDTFSLLPHRTSWDTVDWDAGNDPDRDWRPAAGDSPEQFVAFWQDAMARLRSGNFHAEIALA